MDAWSAGVEESGIEAFIAASAFVENGQNAFTRVGKNVVASALTTNPSMRNEVVDLMEKRVSAAGLSNTEMTYMQDISHSLNTSVSVDR